MTAIAQTALLAMLLLAADAAPAQKGEGPDESVIVYACVIDGVRHYLSRKPVDATNCYAVTKYPPSAPRPGPGWEFVASMVDSDVYRMQRNANRSAAWVMYNYREVQPYKAGVGEHRSTIERWNLDCKEASMGTSQRTYYSDQFGTGTVVTTWQAFQKPLMSYAIPNSVGEAILNQACFSDSKKGL